MLQLFVIKSQIITFSCKTSNVTLYIVTRKQKNKEKRKFDEIRFCVFYSENMFKDKSCDIKKIKAIEIWVL